MKTIFKLSALALAVGLVTSAQAATVTVNANSKVYINFDSIDPSTGEAQISTTQGVSQLMLDKGTVRALLPAAYTGQQGSSAFNNFSYTNATALTYSPLLGASRQRHTSTALISPRNANGDALDTWNKNWWGTALVGWGVGGGNIRSVGSLSSGTIDSPLGNKLYDQKVQIKDVSKGLLYSRKLPGQEGDVVALPFNQLIVRTSKGNRFVRLRAVAIGDPASTTGRTLRNWASNNVYFKYAVAGPDGNFGDANQEKDMCISLATDSRRTNPNGFAIQNPAVDSIDNGIYKYKDKTFDYTLIDTDKWYKQQFIDFDTIIDTADAALANGTKPKTVETSGEVDITPYAPALARGYDEVCLAAWNNARPARYYPSLYQRGFTVTGADAPISSRRTDWMDNDNDPNNNSYNGNDEWDIAFSFMAVPENFGDLVSRNYKALTQFRVNAGLIGNNAAGTTRTNPGFAAAVLVPGTVGTVNSNQNIGEASGSYTLVEDLDDALVSSDPSVNGKTARELLMANGKSITEKATTFKTDASGNITTNKRVYALEAFNYPTYKFYVKSYNKATNQYVIEYDYLY